MPRPKSLGSYAPLSTSYYRDDAILEAGERAELLYVRGLAYCAESPTDGYISDRQLTAVVGIGMRDVLKRASVLVSVGLWEKRDGGYVVRSWLKWNKSAEAIGRFLKRDRERKQTGIRTESARIPSGIRADSRDQYTSVHDTSVHDTERLPHPPPDPVLPIDIVTPDGATEPVPVKPTLDDHFAEFWSSYPRKVGKTSARTAWDRARKRATVPDILAGVRRMAADPNLPEPQFIPHPSTWLTRGGWDDEPAPARSVAASQNQALFAKWDENEARINAILLPPQIGA